MTNNYKENAMMNFFTFGFLLTFAFSSAGKSSPAPTKHHQKVTKTKGVRAHKVKRTILLGKGQPTKAPEKEVHVIMNDPLMGEKWDLQKIQARSAWLKFSKGSRDIVVAVIDTGIDVQHPDLKANIWKNPKEIPGNQKDDDGNGYVDDIHGWNFVANNNRVNDTHGHGTHIAGIIGAVGGNNIGLSGVAPKVSLMALKYYDSNDNGKNNLTNTVKAIQYAIQNGAHIINYSGGGLEPNIEEKKAILEADKKGILFVAAAGNERSNIDNKISYYPARYEWSNILPVTATDEPNDRVLLSSNYGKTVSGAAPGKNILSTLPGGKYGRMTGTSQATAVATGAAVLIMDYYKSKTARFAIKHLKMTGDIKNQLHGKTTHRRRLNIFRALQARGKAVNFMDEKVDFGGKKFLHALSEDGEALPPGRALSSFDQTPLQEEQRELDMISQIMDTQTDPKQNPKNEQAKTKNRAPSSNQKKIPLLKRWFLKK